MAGPADGPAAAAHPARDNLDAMHEYSGDPIGSPPSLELAGLLLIRPMTDRPWRGRLDVARRARIAPRTGLGLSPHGGPDHGANLAGR